MKNMEKREVVDLVKTKILKRGIPINVQTGSNSEVAEWVGKLLEELLPVDEPLGVVIMHDYNACPKCNSVVGTYSSYCKRCGSYLNFNPKYN